MVSSPWWFFILSTFGWGVISSAWTVEYGLAVTTVIMQVVMGFKSLTGFISFIGILYCFSTRRLILPLIYLVLATSWAIHTILPVFTILFATVGLWKIIIPSLRSPGDGIVKVRRVVAILFLGILVAGIMANSSIPLLIDASTQARYTEYVRAKQGSFAAMEWVRLSTDPYSYFIMPFATSDIARDDGDWFPAIARRVLINNPFGAEFTGYYHETVEMDYAISHSSTLDELVDVTRRYEVIFTHIYLKKDAKSEGLLHNLSDSPMVRLVYQNPDIAIFERTDDQRNEGISPSSQPSSSSPSHP